MISSLMSMFGESNKKLKQNKSQVQIPVFAQKRNSRQKTTSSQVIAEEHTGIGEGKNSLQFSKELRASKNNINNSSRPASKTSNKGGMVTNDTANDSPKRFLNKHSRNISGSSQTQQNVQTGKTQLTSTNQINLISKTFQNTNLSNSSQYKGFSKQSDSSKRKYNNYIGSSPAGMSDSMKYPTPSRMINRPIPTVSLNMPNKQETIINEDTSRFMGASSKGNSA